MMSAMSKKVRAAWAEPMTKPSELETLKKLFWENAGDYFSSSSMHGYRYISEAGLHWMERLIWVVVHITAALCVTYIILHVWDDYLNAPTFTTVDSTAYPISKISFPAVAVCNNNKISRSRARRLAEQLAPSRNASPDELFALLWNIGKLYNFNDRNRNQVMRLHEILTANNHTYNVTRLAYQMSPSCKELLVRCMWKGREENCESLFKLRGTMEGYCCMFNYVRARDDFVIQVSNNEEFESSKYSEYDEMDDRIRRSSDPGFAMGLTVLVNPQIEDYYYPLIPSYGIKVLVFNPRDFPDTPSGGLIENMVPVGTEVFMRMEATSVYAASSVKSFDLSQRGCLFKSELSQLFAGSYSYSDCIMSCRVRSIETLCDCVPFFYPSLGTSRPCDMRDIPCLARYSGKWVTLRPTHMIEGLEKELEMSLSCEECHPSCSDTTYHVRTTSATLTERRYETSHFLEDLGNLSGFSVFHLFFGTGTSIRLEKQILYYWYDLVSNFGGICGVFVGLSFISVVEFLYFFTLRFILLVKDSNRSREKIEELKSSQQNKIYWGEVAPSRHFQRY